MLLAYCISDPDRDPNLKRSLRSWLNARLPAFMVPHQFVFLSRFPLTVNGKIDSAALREQRPRTFVARRDAVTATEATLISIWETLLNVQGVRPTDRFVDLGGDSMRAIRLQTEVCRVFDKRVPLAALLKAERICDQARLLSTTRRFSHTTRPRIK